MKKVTIIAVLIAALIFLYLYLRGSRDRRLMHRGNEIVRKIERFRSKEKRLPGSLEDLGVVGENDLFYNRWDSVNYMIWYGTDLGESMTYYSDSRKWEDNARGFK